jgi:hypothetical protein
VTDDLVFACGDALIKLGRGYREGDEDPDEYARECAEAWGVLADAEIPAMAEAIRRLVANGDARFVVDAIKLLARMAGMELPGQPSLA